MLDWPLHYSTISTVLLSVISCYGNTFQISVYLKIQITWYGIDLSFLIRNNTQQTCSKDTAQKHRIISQYSWWHRPLLHYRICKYWNMTLLVAKVCFHLRHDFIEVIGWMVLGWCVWCWPAQRMISKNITYDYPDVLTIWWLSSYTSTKYQLSPHKKHFSWAIEEHDRNIKYKIEKMNESLRAFKIPQLGHLLYCTVLYCLS